MIPLTISGTELKIDDVVAVADGRFVQLDLAAISKISQSRAAVEQVRQLMANGTIKETVEERLENED